MKYRVFVTAMLFGALAACGDSGTDPVDGTDLSAEEINALFSELGSALSNIGSGVGSGPNPGMSAAPVEFSVTINETIACDSGIMAFSGSSDGIIDSETGSFDITMDQVHEAMAQALEARQNTEASSQLEALATYTKELAAQRRKPLKP